MPKQGKVSIVMTAHEILLVEDLATAIIQLKDKNMVPYAG